MRHIPANKTEAQRLTQLDLTARRLFNQQLSAPRLTDPAAVVGWMGAVQAQDYGMATWAVGLRLKGATEASVQQALDAGAILRTHVLRPTWHFVTPADIRWLLELTAPRVRQQVAYYDRQREVDDALLSRAFPVIERALADDHQLTRPELGAALQAEQIDTSDTQRLGHFLMHAELAGLICSGARRGKQPTYALLAERAPDAKPLPRDEALAELTRRYFSGHAPATLKDFAWWSGLTVADCKQGLEMVAGELENAEIGGESYWFAETASSAPAKPVAYLLPNYDEYVVGYTDRSTIYDPVHDQQLDARGNFLFNHTIVLDGQVVGIWRRTLKKAVVMVELQPFVALSAGQEEAIRAAAQRFADFLGLSLTLDFT